MSSVHDPEASAVRVVTLGELRSAEPVPLTIGNSPERGLVDERQRRAIIGFVRLDRLVGDDDVSHQLIELRVVKHRPPLAFRLAFARRRDLPALDLLELRRDERRRPLEVGADRRASRERQCREERRSGRGETPRRAVAARGERRLGDAPELVARSPARSGAGYVRSPRSDGEIPLPAGLPSPGPLHGSFRRHPLRRRKSRPGRLRTRFGAFSRHAGGDGG